MATVYLGEDLQHHREVAIKVLDPDVSAAIGATRFRQEIELTAGLQHPHILPLFDSGEADGLLFYVMPYVAGENLRDRLQREQRLPVANALAIAHDVAAALIEAHARGVVHRDIKPENILLSGGEALVADFGIALAASRVEADRLTATGLSLGTPAYMSPEQIVGDRHVDGRSDQYALACVLYEMLVGQPPFAAPTPQAIVARALVEVAPRASASRSDVPATADTAIARALSKDPADRFDTVSAFAAAAFPTVTPVASGLSRRALLIGATAILVILTAAGVPLWSSWLSTRARSELTGVAALAERGAFVAAFEALQRLERRLPGDSVVGALMARVSDLVSVTTSPPGAAVYLEPMSLIDGVRLDSVRVGSTPLAGVRVPRVDHRVIVSLAGHRPAERLASSALARSTSRSGEGRDVTLSIDLHPESLLPADMVAVPGGDYSLVGPDLPQGKSVELSPFFLDRFEVSNAKFRDFVRSGGYVADDFWPAGLARARFVDRTGLAGPREWRNQGYPDGKAQHPVTGVSWWEARAYCASRGMRLPTLFEWEKASRDGATARLGIVMPWGYVSATTGMERRANFSSAGTVPVDAMPFGISPFGVHALVGNVKEWLENALDDGRAVAGGSWEDPAYVYSEVAAVPDTTAQQSLGFRCARTTDPAAPVAGSGRLELRPTPPVYRPVSAERLAALRAFYRYDPRPANPRVTDTVQTADWRRERAWIDGLNGDSVLTYLYLPTTSEPPYQTIVYVPSSSAFFFQSVWEAVEAQLAPMLRAGRAVFAVVFDGMIERPSPPGAPRPEPSSVGFRDQMVRHATELRLGVDYLVTRPEIDRMRLAYYGMSWGAGSRLVFAGVDDRWRALVLVGAGIDERMQPTLPEAANFNFAAHLRQPKLMVNGRLDEEHPWATRAKPLWDLLPEPKELLLIDGAGHHPPLELRAPGINAFLDRTLGAVRLRGAPAR